MHSSQYHKSISAIATRDKSSMGSFFGCKSHLITNQLRNVISTILSNRHTADIKMVEQLVKGLKTKIYADRGYINHRLKSKLKVQDIILIKYPRKKHKL
ncbi:transposase [Acinetobacter sp. ANC 4470]|uniref:transposase n=1 Tax=Acinetobacter sp. ANC 4470 TaxID=1977881 RepID=UPI003A0FC7B7